MRVGHVFNEYCNPKGPWRHWIATNPNVDSAVYCMRRREPVQFPHQQIYVERTAEFFRRNGRTRTVRLVTRPASSLAHRYTWNKFLREFDPHVLHVQFADKAARFLRMLQRSGRPVVVTCHGSDVNTAKQRSAEYRSSLLDIYKHATIVQCVSTAVMEAALESGCPEEKIRVLYIGCPLSGRMAVRSTRKLDCIFACVGSLIETKAHHTLLRAFAIARKSLPEARLELYGSGPREQYLRDLAAELHVQEAVSFHGHLPHDQVQQQMTGVDVAMLVSEKHQDGRGEGLPISLTEAGGLGLPAIGTRCDGIAELIVDNETGILVEQRDVQSLARAMVRLAEDPGLRSAMGDAACRRVSTHFSLQRQLQKLAALYEEALVQHRAEKGLTQRQC